MPSGPKKRRAQRRAAIKKNDDSSSSSSNPAEKHVGAAELSESISVASGVAVDDVKNEAAPEMGSSESDPHIDLIAEVVHETGSKESDRHVDQIAEAISEMGLKDPIAEAVPEEGFKVSDLNVDQIAVEPTVTVNLPENVDKVGTESVEIIAKSSGCKEKESDECLDEQMILEGNGHDRADVDENYLQDTPLMVDLDEPFLSEGTIVDAATPKEPQKELLESFVDGDSSILVLNEADGRVKALLEKGVDYLSEIRCQAETQMRFANEMIQKLTQVLDELDSVKDV